MRQTILFLVISVKLFGQTNLPDQIFTVLQLQEDFRFMRNKLETKNPNLYLYNDKKTLDQKFDELYSGIDKPMTATAFYKHISEIQPIIKDGHNYILPSKELQNYFLTNELYFPLNFVVYEQKLIVTQNLSSDNSINSGDEIVSINGKNALELFNEMVNLQVRDGYNLQYPKFITQSFFRSYYGFFFGFCPHYVLEIKTEKSGLKKFKINALPIAEIKKNRITKYPLRYDRTSFDKGIFWETNIEKNYTLLSIKSWDNKSLKAEYKQNFKKEIKTFISELEKSNPKNLIIDIRGNQGGAYSNGIFLLKHLFNHSFHYYYSTECLNNNGKLKNCLPFATTEKYPKKYVYSGNIFVLVNGGSFSNSGIFSSLIQLYKRGKIVGEETGGNAVTLTGGEGNYILPNTKINFLKATIKMVVTDKIKNTGHGVTPDIIIEPTLEQILNNDDITLKETIKLCSDKK